MFLDLSKTKDMGYLSLTEISIYTIKQTHKNQRNRAFIAILHLLVTYLYAEK